MQGDLAGTSDWPEAGFPGIRINPLTLLPEVINDDVCRAAVAASADPADRIYVLIVQGHANEAAELLAEARFNDPESFRLRAFEAEVLRISHRSDRAVELFKQLLGEFVGTDREALIQQYLGKTHFAAGHAAAAVDAFSRALDLRVSQSADAAQIYSSTVALQRARDVLDLAS